MLVEVRAETMRVNGPTPNFMGEVKEAEVVPWEWQHQTINRNPMSNSLNQELFRPKLQALEDTIGTQQRNRIWVMSSTCSLKDSLHMSSHQQVTFVCMLAPTHINLKWA